MRKLLLGLIAAVGVVFTSSLARADHYGAITYSPSTGQSGSSWSYCSRDEAEHSALAWCAAGDCRTLVWLDDECGALATSQDHGPYGWAWSPGRGAAETAALDRCSSAGGVGCHVQASVCSF